MTEDLGALIENLVFMADTVHAPRRSRDWNEEEMQFLRDSMGYLTEGEIGAILGRPREGVHLKRERLGMPPTSQTPGWLSAEQVRLKLGLNDGRRIASWVKRGMVKGHILGGARPICMVHEISLRRFVCNPMNWPWFRPEQVRDAHLRRLLEIQKERWGDEWLTPKQAAGMMGLDVRNISQYVRLGRLRAVHTWNLDGRYRGSEKGRWANYWVLRSEAEKARIYRPGESVRKISEAGLEWIKKALGMGWTYARIGRSMKRSGDIVAIWCEKMGWEKKACKRGKRWKSKK